MKLIIDIDDKDFELINKTGITIDLNTAFHGKEKDKEMTFAIFNLVKALKNGTPYEVKGDLISRSVLDEIRQLYKDYQPNLATEVIEFGDALEKLIDNAQTVTTENELPNGWKRFSALVITCKKCNKNIPDMGTYIPMNFCPICGADMRKGAEYNE